MEGLRNALIALAIIIVLCVGVTLVWWILFVTFVLVIVYYTAKYYGNKLGRALRKHNRG